MILSLVASMNVFANGPHPSYDQSHDMNYQAAEQQFAEAYNQNQQNCNY